jgi:5-methylcytosine-specific restriction endonuclease McrA
MQYLSKEQKIKEQIRLRDNYECQDCHIKQKQFKIKLAIHHIDQDRNNNYQTNLITLCSSCHRKRHGRDLDVKVPVIMDAYIYKRITDYRCQPQHKKIPTISEAIRNLIETGLKLYEFRLEQ